MMIAAATGAAWWPAFGLKMTTLDARPEAIVMGGTLLALASILRKNLDTSRVK